MNKYVLAAIEALLAATKGKPDEKTMSRENVRFVADIIKGRAAKIRRKFDPNAPRGWTPVPGSKLPTKRFRKLPKFIYPGMNRID